MTSYRHIYNNYVNTNHVEKKIASLLVDLVGF